MNNFELWAETSIYVPWFEPQPETTSTTWDEIPVDLTRFWSPEKQPNGKEIIPTNSNGKWLDQQQKRYGVIEGATGRVMRMFKSMRN